MVFFLILVLAHIRDGNGSSLLLTTAELFFLFVNKKLNIAKPP
jgi:hypothetical protein